MCESKVDRHCCLLWVRNPIMIWGRFCHSRENTWGFVECEVKKFSSNYHFIAVEEKKSSHTQACCHAINEVLLFSFRFDCCLNRHEISSSTKLLLCFDYEKFMCTSSYCSRAHTVFTSKLPIDFFLSCDTSLDLWSSSRGMKNVVEFPARGPKSKRRWEMNVEIEIEEHFHYWRARAEEAASPVLIFPILTHVTTSIHFPINSDVTSGAHTCESGGRWRSFHV